MTKKAYYLNMSVFIGYIVQNIRRLYFKVFPDFKILESSNGRFNVEPSIVDSCISPRARIFSVAHIVNSTIGDYTYIQHNSMFMNTDIGKFCSIGANFVSGMGIHPINGVSTAPMFYSKNKPNGMTLSSENKVIENRRVTIGNDVFIGVNVTVLDGVTIGDGAVVGAGTVVSKDIPPYAVVVGSPMRIVKYRFAEDQIASLLAIKWWNWQDDRLPEIEKSFFDIDGFIKKNS